MGTGPSVAALSPWTCPGCLGFFSWASTLEWDEFSWDGRVMEKKEGFEWCLLGFFFACEGGLMGGAGFS